MNDHYFTAQPASSAELREQTVRLAGREVDVVTAGGVFSPGRVDIGTRVLLDRVPEPPAGDLLDLGCGWGPVSIDAALRAQDAGTDVRIWALDVNERALDLVRRNAADLGLDSIRTVTAEEIPAEQTFSAIWSNPPIRVGKDVLHGLLSTWIPRLAPGSCAHLVVAKKLGADSLTRWLADELGDGFAVGKAASAKGFRILEARRLG